MKKLLIPFILLAVIVIGCNREEIASPGHPDSPAVIKVDPGMLQISDEAQLQSIELSSGEVVYQVQGPGTVAVDSAYSCTCRCPGGDCKVKIQQSSGGGQYASCRGTCSGFDPNGVACTSCQWKKVAVDAQVGHVQVNN